MSQVQERKGAGGWGAGRGARQQGTGPKDLSSSTGEASGQLPLHPVLCASVLAAPEPLQVGVVPGAPVPLLECLVTWVQSWFLPVLSNSTHRKPCGPGTRGLRLKQGAPPLSAGSVRGLRERGAFSGSSEGGRPFCPVPSGHCGAPAGQRTRPPGRRRRTQRGRGDRPRQGRGESCDVKQLTGPACARSRRHDLTSPSHTWQGRLDQACGCSGRLGAGDGGSEFCGCGLPGQGVGRLVLRPTQRGSRAPPSPHAAPTPGQPERWARL